MRILLVGLHALTALLLLPHASAWRSHCLMMAGFSRKTPSSINPGPRDKVYNVDALCLCGSHEAYGSCCKSYHDGVLPPTAEKALRARYTAYAMGVPEYIMQSSHPESEDYMEYMVEAQASSKSSEKRWSKDILRMSRDYKFFGFNITESSESNHRGLFQANITFHILLSEQNGDLEAIQERCTFINQGGRWLYLDGDVEEVPADLAVSLKSAWPQRPEVIAYYGVPGDKKQSTGSTRPPLEAPKLRAETVRASGGDDCTLLRRFCPLTTCRPRNGIQNYKLS